MLILKICKIYGKRKTDIVYDDLRKHFFTENEEFYCVHLLLAIIFFSFLTRLRGLYSYGAYRIWIRGNLFIQKHIQSPVKDLR